MSICRLIRDHFGVDRGLGVWVISCLSALIVVCHLGSVSPVQAELKSGYTIAPKPKREVPPIPPQSGELLPRQSVPFARYEKMLRNSEAWKNLTPEEQQKALDKIQHYRKLFQQHQSELQQEYKALTKKNPKKRVPLSRRRRTEDKNKFEYVWGKWQSLTPYRQKILSKKWKIPNALPGKRRELVKRVWKRLLPVTRLQFLRDIE